MKTEKNNVRFGLKAKLFLLVLISFGLLMSVIIWRIDSEADKVANKAIEQALQRSTVIIASDQESRYQTIYETAISLSRDGRILPRVFEEDSETLQDLTGEFQQALDFDILIFTNEQGVIIARSDKPAAIGRSVQGRSRLFDEALAGRKAQGIMLSKGQLLQIVAVPIFDNVASDIVRGSIALAYHLSPQRANEINQLTDSEIGFFALQKNKQTGNSQPINRFFTEPTLAEPVTDYLTHNRQLWQSLLEDDSPSLDLTFTLEQEVFHGILYPLVRNGGGTLGFVMALKSRTKLLQPFKAIQQQVLIVGSLCLLFASLLAWAIAHRIARPIVALVSVAQRIQNGDYPEPDAQFYKKSDEVGVLYQAISDMGKNLKDKTELENYLSQVSEGLEMEQQQTEMQQWADTIIETESIELTGEKTVSISATQINTEGATQNTSSDVIISHNPTVLAEGSYFTERYKIIKFLGKGAMGSVQLAMDLELNEQVALKLFFSRNLQGEALNRFKEEIRLARRITHRNILRTFDFGLWKNQHYITMEYIHGFDLNSLIRNRGKLAPKIAIIMGRQICSAIIAAHEQGIIHRDLKPNNIIINKQGVLKIMDFGLAIQIHTSHNIDQQANNAHESYTSIAGTPRYMAPEQFEGVDLDVRTDIYAIGGILYFILSGKSPFDGKSYHEMSDQHRLAKPPILTEIPIELNTIIQKALEKKQTDRYQNVTELLNALLAV